MKERKSNNNNNTSNNSTRTVDREYYAHQETSRNKWFNYTDPYYLNNDQLKNYQENTSNQQQYQNQSNSQNNSSYNSQNSQNSNNSSSNNSKNTGNIKENDTHMGSTTDYTDFALSNQYPHTHDNETSIPEPFTDTESHVNFNTAPQYAGDNQYGSYTRTEESANVCNCDETYASDYNHDNQQACDCANKNDEDCDCGCTQNNKNNSKRSGGMK